MPETRKLPWKRAFYGSARYQCDKQNGHPQCGLRDGQEAFILSGQPQWIAPGYYIEFTTSNLQNIHKLITKP